MRSKSVFCWTKSSICEFWPPDIHLVWNDDDNTDSVYNRGRSWTCTEHIVYRFDACLNQENFHPTLLEETFEHFDHLIRYHHHSSTTSHLMMLRVRITSKQHTVLIDSFAFDLVFLLKRKTFLFLNILSFVVRIGNVSIFKWSNFRLIGSIQTEKKHSSFMVTWIIVDINIR